LFATKRGEDGATIDADIQATTFFFVYTYKFVETKKNKKVQWCINPFSKIYRQQNKNIKVQWCIDAFNTLATTK
jgi:hypothetical protein